MAKIELTAQQMYLLAYAEGERLLRSIDEARSSVPYTGIHSWRDARDTLHRIDDLLRAAGEADGFVDATLRDIEQSAIDSKATVQ